MIFYLMIAKYIDLNKKSNSRMKNSIMKTLLISASIFISSGINAQLVTLNLNNIEASTKTENFAGQPQTIMLKVGSKSGKFTLINDRSLDVKAVYKIRNYRGVRRSNMKKSSIRIFIEYYFTYNGQTVNRKEERLFYMEDELRFDELEKENFQSGIKNTVLTLKYSAVIK